MTRRDPLRLPDPRMLPPTTPKSWREPAVEAPLADADTPGPASDTDGVLVRPFMVTGGRTRPRCDGLKLETMVCVEPAALAAPLQFEQRQVVELARTPMSLAELAARLNLPVGVVWVLLADLHVAGHLSLHEPTALPVDTIERIRDLVRAL